MKATIHTPTRLWTEVQAPALRAEKTRTGSLTKLEQFARLAAEGVVVDGTASHHSAFWHKVPAGPFVGTTTSAALPYPSHVITLGDFAKIAKRGITPAALRAFGRSLVRHEVQHGLRTTTPLEDITAALKSKGIPFRLFNLAEDIRIEHAERTASGKVWGWSKWLNPLAKRTTKPEEFIQTLRMTDGKRKSRFIGSFRTATGAVTETRLAYYWDAFRSAASDMALLPILAEWRLDFPASKGPGGPLTSGRIGTEVDGTETSPLDEGAGDPSAADATSDATTTSSAPAPSPTEAKESKPMKVRTDKPVRVSEAAEASVFIGSPTSANHAEIRRIESTLAGIIENADEEKSAYAMSGRVIGSRAASGESSAFLRREEASGARRILAVVDCSGSMQLRMERFAKPALAALLGLARRGMIGLDIVLTGGGKHHVLRATSTESIYSITATQGCETVRDTLVACDRLVRQADVVAIFTDGDLTDGFVNAGEWRARGVDLIGVCGSNENPAKVAERRVRLTTHFRTAILDSSAEGTARQLVRYVVRERGE